MLKEEKEVALNEVLITCRKVGVHYRQADGLVEDGSLMDMFRQMANRRSNDVSRIEAAMRRLGYLPGEPDKDRLAFSRLITLTRSTVAVANDRQRMLIEKSIELESELDETISIC